MLVSSLSDKQKDCADNKLCYVLSMKIVALELQFNQDKGVAMNIIKKTEIFDEWLNTLRQKNRMLSQRVSQRIRRMSMGNLGDVKSVGGKVSEARIFSTPALRL